MSQFANRKEMATKAIRTPFTHRKCPLLEQCWFCLQADKIHYEAVPIPYRRKNHYKSNPNLIQQQKKITMKARLIQYANMNQLIKAILIFFASLIPFARRKDHDEAKPIPLLNRKNPLWSNTNSIHDQKNSRESNNDSIQHLRKITTKATPIPFAIRKMSLQKQWQFHMPAEKNPLQKQYWFRMPAEKNSLWKQIDSIPWQHRFHYESNSIETCHTQNLSFWKFKYNLKAAETKILQYDVLDTN